MVAQAVSRLGIPQPVADLHGRGVIIGIVDTGINVAAVGWTATVESAGIQGVNYSIQEVDPATLTDEDGHGTSVAQIAHSVAPGATIIAVKAHQSGGGILEAVKWIVRKAGARPLVINISQGGNHADPHDGTDDVSLGLDGLVRPGLVFCVAAGNDGPGPLHVSALIDHDAALATTLWVQAADIARDFPLDTTRPVMLRGYLSGASNIVVMVDDDQSLFPLIATNGQDDEGVFGDARVSLMVGRTPMGDSTFALMVESAHESMHLPATGRWLHLSVRLSESNEPLRMDIWSENYGGFFASMGPEPFPAPHGDSGTMIASPAAAKSAICVGAVCDRDEETLALFPPGLSDLTPFSNSGPTRDGRPSPDLTAAGVKLTIGGSTVDRGTSYSTPIVTGVVARMLASNPQLTVTEVRGLLTSTAVLPKTVEGADERGYHPHAGFGELSGAGLLKKGAIVV